MEGGEPVKAIVINQAGGPEVLSYEDVDEPVPGAGELLVEVAAAGLNFIDTYHRTGLYPMDFPIIPGMEGAGTVVATGEGVAEFVPGDQVAWAETLGSYAQMTVVPAERAVLVLPGVHLDLAAAVLLQGMTAHYLANDTFPLREGHICLVHAGAGGVGLLLTQIANRAGARVITTVGSEEKAELSRRAGASDVIVYTDTDFKEAIEELVGQNALDVVFDGVGAATFEKGLDLLRPRGMMVTFGNASGAVPAIPPLLLSQKGSLFLTRPTMRHYLQTRGDLLARAGDLFSWIESGELEVLIGERFPLEDAAEAHRALEARRTTGKVLLVP
jgi:NADPH2:quinone reductase